MLLGLTLPPIALFAAHAPVLRLEPIDVGMLAVLPVLLLFSGFFSGSETALFAMSETERMHLRRRGGIAGRATESLLRQPRMLLITVLLGNMIANVSYFVISSVLIMRVTPDAGVLGGAVAAIVTLLAIVLIGEVLPKMTANAHRERFAGLAAPPMLVLHNFITPLRIALDRAIVTPLSRLTAPSGGVPPQLDEDELRALLEISSRQGVINVDEQRILREVMGMSRLRVRDVMTPRVRMAAVPVAASPEDVLNLARETRHTKFPVYVGDMDTIVGILSVKRFLLESRSRRVSVRSAMSQAVFAPQIATLDQFLEHVRRARSRSAIAVDEFGGTAGIISIEDVIERLVGDVTAQEERAGDHGQVQLRQMGTSGWEVDGDMSVHDWAEAFGQRIVSKHVATLGGLMIEHLGRPPHVGDIVRLANVELEVLEVDRARVVRAAVRLRSAHAGEDEHGR